jgi:PBP1b-binding outer membrane lipoprotein LpoB
MAIATYFKTVARVSMLTLILAGCEGQSMDQVFGIGDANPPSDQVSVAPKPKPTATPTPPAPSPTPTPASAILKRNVAFDSIRSKGIGQILTHEIDPGVATLNSAYRLKPNDRSIKIWLDAVANAKVIQAKNAKGPGAMQNPMPGQPGAPNGNQAMQPPGAPAVPGAVPAPMPSAGQIDPRLVF